MEVCESDEFSASYGGSNPNEEVATLTGNKVIRRRKKKSQRSIVGGQTRNSPERVTEENAKQNTNVEAVFSKPAYLPTKERVNNAGILTNITFEELLNSTNSPYIPAESRGSYKSDITEGSSSSAVKGRKRGFSRLSNFDDSNNGLNNCAYSLPDVVDCAVGAVNNNGQIHPTPQLLPNIHFGSDINMRGDCMSPPTNFEAGALNIPVDMPDIDTMSPPELEVSLDDVDERFRQNLNAYKARKTDHFDRQKEMLIKRIEDWYNSVVAKVMKMD